MSIARRSRVSYALFAGASILLLTALLSAIRGAMLDAVIELVIAVVVLVALTAVNRRDE